MVSCHQAGTFKNIPRLACKHSHASRGHSVKTGKKGGLPKCFYPVVLGSRGQAQTFRQK
jgi:hypothetical protein